ncbi:MAG TPA: hypothetical protein VHS52_06570 [Acidimicrobiales bacterium]|jgi:hypothetical protein|nr:hypothetical protein [Acidimicrobiales bacterium]
MHLRGREGNELGLSIVGYQFPDQAVDPWESNALLVAVRVVSPHGSWEVVDSCLTTWEASRLASWLTSFVVAGDRVPAAVTAPNLTVSARPATASTISLVACFELEQRPPWLVSVGGDGALCVELEVSTADVVVAAAALRTELASFPQRGDDPTV